MQIKSWYVVDTPKTQARYYYGDLEELKEENPDVDFSKIVPYKKWTGRDCAEIMSNIMEDANKHRQLYIPHMVLDVLTNQKLEENKIADIMREFMEKEIERIYR